MAARGFRKVKRFALDVPRICAYCRHYKIFVDSRGAFCLLWGKPFPEQREWVRNEKIKKPGERVCRKWEG